MVIGKILFEGVRVGARYFPKTIYQIKRADVRIHKSLYGASGGRGVRHGRDLGSLGAGLYQGTRNGGNDIENAIPFQPRIRTPSRKFNKARSGRGNKRRYKRCVNYPSRRRYR